MAGDFDALFVHAPGAGWRDLLPGAIFVGVGIQVLHLITVYWITHLLTSKSETYGAIGAALAILFWAYLLGRVVAASAVVNAAAWHQRHRIPLPPPPPPPPRDAGTTLMTTAARPIDAVLPPATGPAPVYRSEQHLSSSQGIEPLTEAPRLA